MRFDFRSTRPVPKVGALPLVSLVATAVAAGAVVVLLSNDPAILLSAAIGGVIVLALALRAAFGGLDPFEPLIPFAVMWAVMFVVRPIAMVTSGDTSLRETYDARPELSYALLLSLAAALSFLIGYAIRRIPGRPRSVVVPRKIAPLARMPTLLSASFFGVIGLAATATALSQGSFRAEDTTISGYALYAPLFLVPSALLLLTLRPRRSLYTVVAWSFVALLVTNYWFVGQRFFGLLPVVSLITLYYLQAHRRPSAVSMTAFIVATVALLSVLEGLRPQAVGQGQTGLTHSLTDPTTEELPAFAVMVETRNTLWHYQPGYLLYSIAVHWIPHQLWSSKPESYGEVLYSKLFPANYSASRNGTLFSILGDFYYDSGPVGVVIGMFVLGLLLRAAYERFLRRARGDLAAALYAPLPILMVTLLRGDLTLAIPLGVYIYTPMVVATYLRRMNFHVALSLRGERSTRARDSRSELAV
jgi:oligosaccharide repeat unit polymerase